MSFERKDPFTADYNDVLEKHSDDRDTEYCLLYTSMKDLKELSVYIKAEEAKAYYVINGEISGSIDL